MGMLALLVLCIVVCAVSIVLDRRFFRQAHSGAVSEAESKPAPTTEQSEGDQ